MPPHDCAQCSCVMHIHGIMSTSVVTPNLDRVSLIDSAHWTHTHEAHWCIYMHGAVVCLVD
jgi:hypothetical protein